MTIRYFDKELYFPGQPIQLKIDITNNGTEPFRFKLANLRVHSFNFSVRTLTNTPLRPSDFFTILHNSQEPVFYREIVLDSGESFSIIEDFTDYIEPLNPGIYVIQGHFFPELDHNDLRISSNIIQLSVRPTLGTTAVQDRIDVETGEILKRADLSPDKVVKWTLKARQMEDWNKFFLYLDLESLFVRYADRENQYRNASDDLQRQLLKKYRDDLENRRIDSAIVTIPDSFTIVRTEYTAQRGRVIVDLRFRYTDYFELKRYSYDLLKRDNIWVIHNYSVENRGTE